MRATSLETVDPAGGADADGPSGVDRRGRTVSGAPSYCPDCGAELGTRRIEGRDRAYCGACDRPVYRNAKPAAGVVVVDGARTLLVRRTNLPAAGSWSLPAGFLEHDEPPREGAVRELDEETGLVAAPESLVLSDTAFVDRPGEPSVLVVVYAAPRAATTGEPTPGSDAGAARFWRLDDLAAESVEPGYAPVLRRAVSTFGGASPDRRAADDRER
jgi:ADP-ribose pyrophosphatase YjhB (NUDIX family)